MGATGGSGRSSVNGHRAAAVLLTALLIAAGAVVAEAQSAAPRALPPDLVLPSNLVVPDVIQPLVTAMWQRSPTFRRQCARLAETPGVVVRLEVTRRTGHAVAIAQVKRHAEGIEAALQIEWRKPDLYVEHVAHELEHVLEHVDGVDIARLERQGLDGVMKVAGIYETARARAVGRVVAREALP